MVFALANQQYAIAELLLVVLRMAAFLVVTLITPTRSLLNLAAIHRIPLTLRNRTQNNPAKTRSLFREKYLVSSREWLFAIEQDEGEKEINRRKQGYLHLCWRLGRFVTDELELADLGFFLARCKRSLVE
jgi:hypothetical protein